MARVRDPLNLWPLNANSSKMVKVTDFKFDVQLACSQGQSGHNPFKKGGVCTNSLGGDMHSHERILVIIAIIMFFCVLTKV